jgi:hypothetical protein
MDALSPQQKYDALLAEVGEGGVARAKALLAAMPGRQTRKDTDGVERAMDIPIIWETQPPEVLNVLLRAAGRGYFLAQNHRIFRWRKDGSVYSSLCFVGVTKFGGYELKEKPHHVEARRRQKVLDRIKQTRQHADNAEKRSKQGDRTVTFNHPLTGDEVTYVVTKESELRLAASLRKGADAMEKEVLGNELWRR